MSVWTHVVGSIRIDGLPGMTSPPDLGRTCSYEDDQGAWDMCNVPCGSEGSLTTHLWQNPDQSAMAIWTVSVFGDLRDYEDDQEVIDYFNRIVEGQMVRQGVFSIEVEGRPTRTFCYVDGVFVETRND